MNLTLEPELATWPQTHYAFIEKAGPFPTSAPQAWQELHRVTPTIEQHNTITKYFSLYKMKPQIYRAGLGLASEPKDLPPGVRYELFLGGNYSRFTLTGPYSNLPEASGRLWRIVAEKKLPLRDDFNIENYVNDPRNTPENQLITEILFPTV